MKLFLGRSYKFQSLYARNFTAQVGDKTGKAADSLLGGMSRENFYFLTEKSCPFIKDVLCPHITDVSVGKLTMLLPFKKSFVGNILIPCLHGGSFLK